MSKTKSKTEAETPLMKQYNQIKAKHPDALLLFRVGDFYETFGDDAVKASKVLGIVLTKRKNGAAAFIDLAGFPYHSLENYLPKLVRAGYRVAICDQLEDPKLTKTIVKRGVTELVTPGVSLNDNVLNHNENNFLACIHVEKDLFGIAFIDISTGEFLATQGNIEFVQKLLGSLKPNEVLFQKSKQKQFTDLAFQKLNFFSLDDWVFTSDFTKDLLLAHFETTSLKGFGIEDLNAAIIAAGACLHYLSETRHDKLKHINKISRLEKENYVWLDHFTIRNLELFQSFNNNGKSLISVLDKTQTPMGSRLLKRWLALPLKEVKPIIERQAVVKYFVDNQSVLEHLDTQIKQIGDLERLISKVSVAKANPKEILQIFKGLKSIQPIKQACLTAKLEALNNIGEQFNPCKLIADKIEKTLTDDPPILVSKGSVIAPGVNSELDELRQIAFSGKDFLAKLQVTEQENTGIPSLKIGFNNVFGYYLEVTNTHKNKVPSDWIRKQTLVNAERYVTQELKEYEQKILGAEEKISLLESQLFDELVFKVSEYLQPIQLNANLIAKLDCLLSFAKIAITNNYQRPQITEGKELKIVNGRHPVIELELPIESKYVANDLALNRENQQIIMITGPNMSGKSAILRQTALIVLLAQMGSFVPAQHAEIGIIDKIFTRVGASDNLSQGESTFMVEMNETASILNNLSDRSLILLDEIGRGTSTYDGISIAWAIAEFLHQHAHKPLTLFATHYHELNEMAGSFERIKNYNVSVKELQNKVLFLRKLVPGGSEHSFGIHVAKMAGMPPKLIAKANKILESLENSNLKNQNKKKLQHAKHQEMQLSFFQLDDPVLSQIKDELTGLNIDTLTPVEALIKLHEIKNLIKA